jgi:hypothetical protein
VQTQHSYDQTTRSAILEKSEMSGCHKEQRDATCSGRGLSGEGGSEGLSGPGGSGGTEGAGAGFGISGFGELSGVISGRGGTGRTSGSGVDVALSLIFGSRVMNGFSSISIRSVFI